MLKDFRSIAGILLILVGVALALQQYGVIGGEWNNALFAGLYALGAVYFFNLYRQNTLRWWFGFLGLLLMGLAIGNLLDLLFPAVGNLVGGAIFLGMIGVGFLIAYYRNPVNWWAIIPAGALFSLALISVLDELPTKLPFESGSVLFFGLGLTFLTLALVKANGQRLTWGIFPGIALIIFGLFVGFGEAAAWNYIWPILIIVFGLYFLVSALRRR